MAETNPEDKLTKKSNTIAQQLKSLNTDLKELGLLLDSGFGRIKEITGPKRRGYVGKLENKKDIQALVKVFKAEEEKYNAAKASIKKVQELSTGLSLKNINNDVVNEIFEELAIIKTNSNFIITRAKLHEQLEGKSGYVFTEEAHGYEGTMAFPDLSDFKKGLGNPKFAGDPGKKKSEKSILQRAVENRKRLFADTNTSIRGSLENALKPKPKKNKEGVAKTTAAKKVREENINYLEKLKSGNLQESEYNKAASAIIKQVTGFANRKKSKNFDPEVDISKYSDDVEKQTGYTLDQILALNTTDNKNVGKIIIEGIKRKKEERFSSKISPSTITESEAKNISEAVTNTSQSIEKESNASGPKLSERINPKTGLPYPVLTREMKEAMGIGKNTVLAEQVIGKSIAQQQEEASKNIKEEVITNELGAKITKIISPESSPIEATQKISSALVPYTGPGQTSGSDFDYLQEYADKLRNEKSQSSSKSSIEKAANKGVQKKTRTKKGGGKIVSLGGGAGGTGSTGGGGTGGGGGGGGTGGTSTRKVPGDGSIIDVRLVEISTKSIKQLEDLLIKVLKKSNITASKTLSASTNTGAKIVPIGGTTPTTSSGGKIIPFNNTATTPGGLTVIPGGLSQSTTPGGTSPSSTPGGTTPPTTTGGGGGRKKGRKTKTPIAELDPFQKRLKKIYEEGREEITLLYAKVNSYLPIFTNAQVEAKKTALNTLKEGYRAFNVIYQRTGSSFKGMIAAINKMFKISPITVVLAGMTIAFTGILSAANRLNTRIKEISAELGTSNMQSYELFKNAMNAQTQYDNMYASLRDVRDVQKGILGDSGILLQVNDKALASVADNAKNIGLSVESAGAFYENLRMKGGSDKESSNLMAASLELADKKGFSPQSIVDDIAQNAEFASKYFSNINKHSKSAHRNLIETNLQVKALGLNFQKAAKMTQHLLSFEQSIVAEVEASVALGRHVNIGKARELLLQDDIAGAMTQMMDTMGGYDAFQNDMDFAQRQLLANAVGMEVSELEKSLYLREKIGLKDAESLDAAMKNSDYLDKVAGKDVELYKIETKKVMAAERFNTAIEKVSVAFKSSLLPILEAIVPIVDHMAWAINLVAEGVKFAVGGLASGVNFFSGGLISSKRKDENTASPAEMASGGVMMSVMGASIIGLLKSKAGGKIGEVVGKARGGLDAVTGALGSKSNPMYVQIVGGSGGAGGIGEILDSAGGGGKKGGRAGFLKRMLTSKNVVDRAKSIQKIRDARLSTPKTGAFAKIGQYMSKVKPASMIKLGGALAVFSAGYDIYNRKQQGQSNSQAVTGTAGGVAGALLGAKGGALAGAAIGGAIGTAVPVIGNIVGAAVGGAIGGLAGGAAGYYAGGAIVDSQFNKKPSSSYQTQPFQYQGMGLSAAGSIYEGVNKPKAIGTPVETSMVDTTPTTLKPNFSSPFSTTPNFGTTSMSRNSLMTNTQSKSVATIATMQNTIKEKEKKDEELLKATDYTNKLLEAIVSKQNSPVIAYFNDEGRRQVKSTLRKESSP